MIEPRCYWVTGATGRLGCEVTTRLEELGARPVPLVLEGYSTMPTRWPWTAEAAPVPVASAGDLAALPSPDHVLNLHWCVNRDLDDEDELVHDIDRNIRGPAFLWEWLAASDCQRFVNVSTIKVFSHLNPSPVAADAEPRPDTAYGLAKLTGERYLDARFDGTSVTPIHVRLASLAAAGGYPTQLMPRLCDSAFGDRPMRINRNHAVHLLHVAEAADLLIAAALTDVGGPIVTAPPAKGVAEIARLFEAEAGVALDATYVEDASGTTDPTLCDNAEALYTDWTRRHNIEELVASIVRQHRAWAGSGQAK